MDNYYGTRPIAQLSIPETYIYAWKRIVNFRDRASRKEYWTFTLGNIAIVIGIAVLISAVNESSNISFTINDDTLAVPIVIAALAWVLAQLSVAVRRLHDTNRSGWWYFIRLIPLVGPVVLFIFCLQESYPYSNSWGPNPYNPSDILQEMDIFKNDQLQQTDIRVKN